MKKIQAICPKCKKGVEMYFYLGVNSKNSCPICDVIFKLDGYGNVLNHKEIEYVEKLEK